MYRSLAFGLLLLAITAQAQQPFEQILRTNPYLSNGYFIVDTDKAAQLNVSRIEVDIFTRKLLPGGGVQVTPVQHFIISGTHYGHVDPALLLGLDVDEQVTYSLTAYDGNNDIVVDILGHSGEPPLPPVCQSLCSRNRFGWKLTAYSDGFFTTIDIQNPGLYFYVKASNWSDFKLLNDPVHYGFYSAAGWGQFDNPNPAPNVDCFKLLTPPLGAKDENGYTLGNYNGPVWAVRKDKGEWRDLWQYSEHVSLGAMCDASGLYLKDYYNANGVVQAAILDLPGNPGELACPGGAMYTGLGPGGNSLDVNCTWTEFTNNEYVLEEDGSISVVAHVLYVLSCNEGSTPPSGSNVGLLADVSSVVINRWDADEMVGIMTVAVPKASNGPLDPRKIYIPRTRLTPGFYEMMIVMDDGQIIRHFEEVTETVVVGARFSSFADIVVYPVPVDARTFAVDLDLLVPMDIQMTVVNNMGVTYYTKALSFTVEGWNKHVVSMGINPWPNGLYHAVFQFADGSTQSISFTVAID